MGGSTGTVAAFKAQPAQPWLDTDNATNASVTNSETLSMQVDYDLGFAQLTVLPAYQYRTIRQSFHFSGNRLNPTNSNFRQRSLELRFSEPANVAVTNSTLNWVAGVFAYSSAGVLFFSNGPSAYSIKSSAAFAQVTLPLGTQWHAVVGARLTMDSKSRTRSDIRFAGHWRNLDYKLGVERDIGAHSLAYLQVTTGYRPGGVYEPQLGSFKSYDPERLKSYELGVKSRWLDERLQVNADVFSYDYRDFQGAGVQSNNSTGAVIFVYQNAPGANASGVELETMYLPGVHDRVELSLAWLTTQFKPGFINNGVDYSGSTLENAPRGSGSARYEHTWPVVRGQLAVSAEVIGKTAYFLAYSQQGYSGQPGYCLVNLGSSYQTNDGRWQFTGWLRNAGNYAVRTAYITTPAAGDFLVISPPRTFGLGMTFRY
jgi:iron complex outermembrane receptor protein